MTEGLSSKIRSGSGNTRTVFVFLDLPIHLEHRAGELPLLAEGTIVEFDLEIKNPRDPAKKRHIQGPHEVVRSILKYATGRPGLPGLTQYVEWKAVES